MQIIEDALDSIDESDKFDASQFTATERSDIANKAYLNSRAVMGKKHPKHGNST